MKFRLVHPRYNPTYFKTKKEALAWLETRTDRAEYTLQKKMVDRWIQGLTNNPTGAIIRLSKRER